MENKPNVRDRLDTWQLMIFAVITGIVFIGLRAFNVTDWSWWAVTAPIWGGGIVFLMVFRFTRTKK